MILNHGGGQRPQIHADFLYASHSGKMYSDLMGRDAPSARADDRGAMLRSRARCLQATTVSSPYEGHGAVAHAGFFVVWR